MLSELLKAVLKGYKGLHTSNMIIILAVLTVYESEYIVDSCYNFDFAVNGGDTVFMKACSISIKRSG